MASTRFARGSINHTFSSLIAARQARGFAPASTVVLGPHVPVPRCADYASPIGRREAPSPQSKGRPSKRRSMRLRGGCCHGSSVSHAGRPMSLGRPSCRWPPSLPHGPTALWHGISISPEVLSAPAQRCTSYSSIRKTHAALHFIRKTGCPVTWPPRGPAPRAGA